MQRYVSEVKADINREIELDELRKLQSTMQDAARSIEQSVSSQVNFIETEVKQAGTEVQKQVESAVAPHLRDSVDADRTPASGSESPAAEERRRKHRARRRRSRSSNWDWTNPPRTTSAPESCSAVKRLSSQGKPAVYDDRARFLHVAPGRAQGPAVAVRDRARAGVHMPVSVGARPLFHACQALACVFARGRATHCDRSHRAFFCPDQGNADGGIGDRAALPAVSDLGICRAWAVRAREETGDAFRHYQHAAVSMRDGVCVLSGVSDRIPFHHFGRARKAWR